MRQEDTEQSKTLGREAIEQSRNTGARSTRRRLAAVLSMVLIVLVTVALMQTYLCIPSSLDENRVLALHREPRDSIDVLLIGSSATYTEFSSAYAYEQFGFTSFPYAIGGATCTMWKLALRDTLRSQRPKLVVVDVFGGGYERELIDTRCSQIYTIMAHYPLSREKVDIAREISGSVDGTSVSSLIFPFLKYHSNVPARLLKSIRMIHSPERRPSHLKGLETRTRTKHLQPVDPESFAPDNMELDAKTEGIIREFIEYCRDNDINVLFVKYPTVLASGIHDELRVNKRANRILEIAAEYGYPGLNMQKEFYNIGLKEREDYYNHGHTNIRGQKKVTEYLGRYIQQGMGIEPSELEPSVRAEWDESVRYYHAFADMAEEMIEDGTNEDIGDSPDLIARLEKRMQ